MNEQTTTDMIHARQALGSVVSQARYTPYGELRWPGVSQMPTDFGYTGQRADSFGLMDYNARFYSPHLGRFVSADTVVPNPGKAVDFDRFAYSSNNPIRYRDPSGHLSCDSQYVAEGDCSDYTIDDLIGQYGVDINVDWPSMYKWYILQALRQVGEAFAEVLGGSGVEAFKEAYGLSGGHKMTIKWNPNCWGCREDPRGCDAGTTTGAKCEREFGVTNDYDSIEFASLSDFPNSDVRELRWINNVIHELGHAFNLRLGRAPEDAAEARTDLLTRPDGFYIFPRGGTYTYMQSPKLTGTEIFADQFLGWVTGKWGNDNLGPVRAEFMTNMTDWVVDAQALGPGQ